MAFQGFQDIQEGDIIECFEIEEVASARCDRPPWPPRLRGANEQRPGSGRPISGLAMTRGAQAQAPSQRQLRVGEQMRHLLAEYILRGDLHDPGLPAAASPWPRCAAAAI